MVLSSDFLQHMDSAAPSAFVLPSTNSLLNTNNSNNNRAPGPGGGGLAANTYVDPGSNMTLAGGGFTMGTMNDGNSGLSTRNIFPEITMTEYIFCMYVCKGGGGSGDGSAAASDLLSVDTSQAVQAGMDLLSRVLKNCPGFIPAVNTTPDSLSR